MRIDTLTPQQLDAVRLLAAGRSQAETAADLGITTRTLFRWRARANFNREYERARAVKTQEVAEEVKAIQASTEITVEMLDTMAQSTLLNKIASDGRIALEYMKLRGMVAKIEEPVTEEPFIVMFGELPKAELEAEEMLKKVPAPISYEPTFKPKAKL